jgi:hypothetical protein
MWGGDMHYENNYAISNNKLCQQETWLHTWPGCSGLYYNNTLLSCSMFPVLPIIDILTLRLIKMLISNNDDPLSYVTAVGNIIYFKTSDILPEMACNEQPFWPSVFTILEEIIRSELNHSCSLK